MPEQELVHWSVPLARELVPRCRIPPEGSGLLGFSRMNQYLVEQTLLTVGG